LLLFVLDLGIKLILNLTAVAKIANGRLEEVSAPQRQKQDTDFYEEIARKASKALTAAQGMPQCCDL
jgi:hypothetical protein